VDFDNSQIAFVGDYPVDLEAVAALNPDLIVSNPWADDLDKYQAIAPTVVMELFEQPMEDALFDFAEPVGKTDRAEELRADVQAEAARLQDTLGDKLTGTTVSIVEYWDGAIYAVPNGQSLNIAVPTLGLQRPAFENEIDDWVTISAEVLGETAADVMVLIAIPDAQVGESDTAFADFMANPAVAATDIGKVGQVYAVHPDAVYGASWGRVADAMRAFAAIIAQDGINRDLVVE
jgi:iron complex transport system substrate-binding protein